MDYQTACKRAHARSLTEDYEDCNVFVCARLVPAPYGLEDGLQPSIDPEGYTVADWLDGSVVASYRNGQRVD